VKLLSPSNSRKKPPKKNPAGNQPQGEAGYGKGALELTSKGYGFLRQAEKGYMPSPDDVFVPPDLIRKFELKEGLILEGPTQPPRGKGGPRLRRIEKINGLEPEEAREWDTSLADLTPVIPTEPLILETDDGPLSMRMVDIIAPVGKGQRGLIVSPPKGGKTILLQQIAQAVATNYDDVAVMVLLIDERPEEVTDWRRKVGDKVEILASTADQETASHMHVVELALEIAKRRVEMGQDVVLLLDSLTRLGRAYNRAQRSTGRTMSGGIDAKALVVPRQIFGAARDTEEAGSLTIVATILIDTGSRMDEVIFQEFKGTGNMEIVLDRRLAEARIFPAIDIPASGTRHEEELLGPERAEKVHMLRRALSGVPPMRAMELLRPKIDKYDSNEQFLNGLPRLAGP